MIMPTQEELVMGERKFLHEMANQILIAHGMISRAKGKNRNGNEENAKDSEDSRDLESLEKALTALNKMTENLRTRRSYLHELSNEFIK